jgi:hypothetical protein
LKELVIVQGNSEENKQFDFGIILGKIAESSSDYENIGNIKTELKINMLSDSLYMGIIRCINLKKPAGELNIYLKDIINLCLYGIINSEER